MGIMKVNINFSLVFKNKKENDMNKEKIVLGIGYTNCCWHVRCISSYVFQNPLGCGDGSGNLQKVIKGK